MSGPRTPWHVAEPDRSVIELSDEALRARIIDNVVTRDTLVWRAGMPDWLPAGAIPELFTPTDSDGPDTAAEQPPPVPDTSNLAAIRKPRRVGYIMRHWRGELSLGVSYWVNGTVAGLVLGGLTGALSTADVTLAPRTLSFSFAVLALSVVPLSVWQLVGIWRSARRRIETRKSQGKWAPWARLAQIATVLGAVSLLANAIIYRLPNVWANLQIAFGQDPTPHHVLRLLNGGREAEISGGIDFGTATDLRALLSASPNVRTIDLDSPGGRVAEAEHIRDLIRERHLATYTNGTCASACTVAYIGGLPRYLGPDGKLGFHRYSFPGFTAEQDNAQNRVGEQELIAAGVGSAFAAKAFSTPSSGLWVPDANELVSAHVVTQLVDGLAFAAPSAAATPENIARTLDGVASFAALKRVEPATYLQLRQSIVSGIQDGKSMQDAMGDAHQVMLLTVAKYRPHAADDVQVRIAAIFAEETRLLAPAHPDACVSLVNGQGGTDYLQYLPQDVRNREIAVSAAIIDSGSTPAADSIASEKAASTQIAQVWSQVKNEGVDLAAIARKPVSAADQRAFCLAMSAFLRHVSTMPAQQAGPLMRYLNKS